MSDVLDTLSALFAEGHKREVPDLLSEGDFADAGRKTKAAVLIAVTERSGADGEPGVILTQRPTTMRDHPGQVAFPGGKQDDGETPTQTALREAQEELALDPGRVTIIGTTDRYQTGTGFDITPVLGVIPPDLPLVAEAREVESWFEVPLSLIMDERNWTSKSAFYRGAHREYLDLDYKGYRIWGVTAGIIANLSRRLGWMERADG